MIGVYKITNSLNGKSYIGQSKNIKRRFKNHKESINRKPDDLRGKGPLYDEMKKYGVEHFVFEVLKECDESQLNELEEYYIKKYDSVSEGYNIAKTSITTNDPDVMNKIQTKEVRERRSKQFSDMNHSNWKDSRYRKEMSERSSQLQKERLKNPDYLKKKSDDLKKHWEKKKKKVAQYSLSGELVKVYDGIRIAERETGISTIHKHIRDPIKRKQAGGFVWRYIE
jgi:group I intron endonuclease